MTINSVAIIASLLAGLSPGLGALVIFCHKHHTKAMLDIGMGFSAGIMLAASFVALILPGVDVGVKVYGHALAIVPVILGLAIGYLLILYSHDRLPHNHWIKSNDVAIKSQLQRVFLISFAICLHNVPEGLSVGIGFGANQGNLGITLAIAIILQNIPEGFIVAIGFLSIGASRMRALQMAILTGMVEPLAATVGFISTQITQHALPLALGFAAGAMLFVICQEILPELFRQGHERKASTGVVAGIITMLALWHFLN